MKTPKIAMIYAILAALFYAVNTPISKLLMNAIPVTFMASFLYLGAGIGVGIMYIFHWKKEKQQEHLVKSDLPYTIGMILLDIIAPIFMMSGIKYGTASNASLLGNFEIVATTVIALCIFKEAVTKRLWVAIGFITLSSMILSFEGSGSFQFSYGSLFVLLATICWGLENNCTRKISEKSTYQIVVLKGIFSGIGSCIIARVLGEKLPSLKYIIMAMLLGFIAYGLSIFTYIRAQRTLGAAKTSAYYALSPFMGAILAFVFVGEKLSGSYLIALLIMLIGTGFVVLDTLIKCHDHLHVHEITHTHDGVTHTHRFDHIHSHNHISQDIVHSHKHSKKEFETMHLQAHNA
ncbi:MAG: DMT family transporter [Oscillospiraceae bacterium]|nr:DMT family transporter [Oscillospiraceae bacterium]